MAQLPVYRQQGNITTQPTGQVRDLDTFAQGAKNMQSAGNMLFALSAKWQESKDAVENLDGKNKLNSGIAAILDEASNYNDYSTPEELSQKQNELTQKMNELVPNIVGGFSNNQTAREFEANGQFATQQNIYKLQAIFRDKYGDMYNANLMETGDSALKSFTLTGDENYKKEYFDAIETGVKAGYLDRTQAEKLKLSTDEWNYDYVYSKTLENPYFKASDEIMSKIDPVKQRTLRNFARAEQKRAQREAEQDALFDFQSNPTQKNYARLCKTNPKYKNNAVFKKQTETPINPNAVTKIEDYQGFTNAILNISKPQTNEEAKMNKEDLVLTKSTLLYTQMNKAMQEGNLNKKEFDKLSNLLTNATKNNTIMQIINQMPNLEMEYFTAQNKTPDKAFYTLKDSIKYSPQAMMYKQVSNSAKAIMARNEINKITKATTEQVIDSLSQGDIQTAQKAYKQGMMDITRKKYWYIPAIQNPNLKVGDEFVLNGKVMQFNGFTGSGKDIIVNTGKPRPTEMRAKK